MAIWGSAWTLWHDRVTLVVGLLGDEPNDQLAGEAWLTVKTLFRDRLIPLVTAALDMCHWIGVALDAYALNDTAQILRDAATRGQVIISYEPLALRDPVTGKIADNRDSAHATVITGQGYDKTVGDYVTVSSWGREYRINLNDYVAKGWPDLRLHVYPFHVDYFQAAVVTYEPAQ